MQKTFLKYTFFILTGAILLILFINLLFTLHALEAQQFATFHVKIDQVIHTLESNQAELSRMNDNLDEDYLTRAKAAAYVLDRQSDVTMDVAEFQYLAKLLNVDEVHVIDENGMIVSGSVSKYIGMDMADHKQTREFLAILESGDEDAYLIQDTQPNASEGKVMKYVGVARKGTKGIVQVGFEPTRQMEAESRNTYDYIFTKFPTDVGEEFFVADAVTGEILGHSNGLEHEFSAGYYELSNLYDSVEGAFIRGGDGKVSYVVCSVYDTVLICAAMPGEIMFQSLLSSVGSTFLYLIFIEIVVLILLNYLVRQKVIDGIHRIIEHLTAITDGNLDTTVAVGGNKEFEELSSGINTMVKSIVNLSDRISAIIELSGIPLAAFEYERGGGHVFVTSGVKNLLALPEREAAALCRDADLFDRYIHTLTKAPLAGETDIFAVKDAKFVRIHMSESAERCLGVITDVTGDIVEKQRMQYENTHDALTGLYKYAHFKQLAEQKLRHMPPSMADAIVMLDLDYFKEINDTFGHNIGDRYLQTFASIMQSMPTEHFLTARRSGDEFCMMIYDCSDVTEIKKYLDDFYEALGRRPVALSDTESKVIRASSGFVHTTDRGAGVDGLLSQADEALYQVKRETKGCYAEYKNA